MSMLSVERKEVRKNRKRLKREERYYSNIHFRELVDFMRTKIKPTGDGFVKEQKLCNADLYDAILVLDEIEASPLKQIADQSLMSHGDVLPMHYASYTETAALAIIPNLWRRRHESTEVRKALHGWIESLRRDRKGYVP